MKSEELAILRRLLEDQLHDLDFRAGNTISDLLNNSSDFEPDPLDRALSDQRHTHTLLLHDRESRLINKIRDCLQAMDDGEYGTCQQCEEPISFARLKARPVTHHCIECKNRLEEMEKIAGY